MSNHGISIDQRHVALLADRMTSTVTMVVCVTIVIMLWLLGRGTRHNKIWHIKDEGERINASISELF